MSIISLTFSDNLFGRQPWVPPAPQEQLPPPYTEQQELCQSGGYPEYIPLNSCGSSNCKIYTKTMVL